MRLGWRIPALLKGVHGRKIVRPAELDDALGPVKRVAHVHVHNPAVGVPIIKLQRIVLSEDAKMRSMHDVDSHTTVHFVGHAVTVHLGTHDANVWRA
jgi:hypothetical protein